MLIPLNHENMTGRRWPYVTFTIIALNALVFLATHWTLDRETAQFGEIEQHVILLAAAHPGTPMTPAEETLVDTFRKGQPQVWERIGAGNSDAAATWDPEMKSWDQERSAQEMIRLGDQMAQMQRDSVLARYAFYPSRRVPISFLTANFLHGGWLHIIFNMWFLWLAGAILEDKWGRPLYAAFYLVSGVAALTAYAMVYPNGLIPVIGASGAIASLMGAFLVRFPKAKIELGFFYWIIRPRLYRFHAPAYAVLPLWLLLQFVSSIFAGESGGVAYWAHVGGFGFGMVLALVLRYTGIERKADQAIESKVSWSADPHIVKAADLMEKDQFDEAIAELKAQIAEKPHAIDAYEMLPSVYCRKGDVASYQQGLETVRQLHLKLRNAEAAWQDYVDYTTAGGERMPAAIWLELCRQAENEQKWELATQEYEKLAKAWPTERPSVLALMSAGRIYLRQLGRRDDAARLYRAAQKSPAPHSDWDETIRKGLEQAGGTAVTQAVGTSTQKAGT